MTRVIGPPKSRRRRWTFLWCLTVALAAGIIFIPGALAVHDLKFELDGNVTTQGSTPFQTGTYDWDSFFNASGAKSPVLPDASRPGFTASSFVRDFNTVPGKKPGTIAFDTSDSSTFTIGSKDILDISGWSCTPANNVTDKGDIMNAYAVAYTDPNTGDQILYFGLERNANAGDANVAFWFLQSDASCTGSNTWTGNHSDGDVLVVSAFTNGGTVGTIDAYRWNGGANGSLGTTPTAHGVDCRNPNTAAGDTTCATSNTGTISTPWQTENKDDGVGNALRTSEFFEGGLNLTDSGLAGKCFNTFVGDTRSSQSLTATLYDFARGTLGECTSTTATTPTPAAGTTTTIPASGTLSTSDSALITVTGVSSFNATVSFFLCGPSAADSTATCDSGGVAAGSPAVTASGTKSSNTMTITSAGRYCWRAEFSGDSTVGVPASSDHSSTECFIVGPRQSTLATTAGAGPVNFGNAVTDTATLGNTANEPGSGGPTGSNGTINPVNAGGPATGSITFTLYKADCSTLATGTGTNPQTITTVSGNGTYGPVSFTPDAPGTYHWVASYSGDLPNTLSSTHNTQCNDTTEDVVVRQIPTTIKTKQSWIPNDTATIAATTGNLAAGGTVAFSLYSNATCSGTALLSESRTLTGGNPTEEVGTTNTTAFNITTGYADAANSVKGPYSWKVVYTPAAADTAHTGKQSSCDAEHFSTTYTNDNGPGSNLP